MDWDKLRIFHAVAKAGTFTHAGEILHLSQSSVSRQISTLEKSIGYPLFQRFARGLKPTEQGDMLFEAVDEFIKKLDETKTRLHDSRYDTCGVIRVTTTIGLGVIWLTSLLREFMEFHPGINIQVILSDDEIDVESREADIAIRLRQPTQAQIIQRRLFTVHFHIYTSTDYLERYGQPEELEDLDDHRIVTFGHPVPHFLEGLNWLSIAGRPSNMPRESNFSINNLSGIRRAVLHGLGIGLLPDYAVGRENSLVRIMAKHVVPSFDCYLAYSEELRGVTRIRLLSEFLIANARKWSF